MGDKGKKDKGNPIDAKVEDAAASRGQRVKLSQVPATPW